MNSFSFQKKVRNGVFWSGCFLATVDLCVLLAYLQGRLVLIPSTLDFAVPPLCSFCSFIPPWPTKQKKKRNEQEKKLSSAAFVLCFFQFLKIFYCHITTVAWAYINRMEYVLLQLDTFLFIFKFILAVLGKKTSTFITGSTRAIFFRIWGKL